MATENTTTPEYNLDSAVAASLRRPLIEYPGGMVPRAVIRACMPHVPPQLRDSHSVRIDDLIAALSPRL